MKHNCIHNFFSANLKLILTIPFCLQIFAIVGTVGYLSLRSGQKAVNDISNQLLTEISFRVEEKLTNYTSLISFLNRSNAQAIQLGELELNNYQSLIKHFNKQIRHFPDISFIYWGNKSGEFYGVRRLNHIGKFEKVKHFFKNGSIGITITNKSTNFQERNYKALSNGNKGDLILINPNKYDSTTRSWYKTAVIKKKPTWSEISTSFTTDLKSINNVYPIYNKNNQIEGVLGISIYFNNFTNFLHQIKVGKTGQVFVVERSGLIIASSTKQEKLTQQQRKEKEDFALNKSRNLLTRTTGQFLLDKFNNNLFQIVEKQTFSFRFNRNQYLVQVAPFKDKYGLDWLIVVVVPESDFMEQIYVNTRNTIVLCIIALIVSIIIGILTTQWITRPILKVNSAAKSLAQGNWSQKIEIERKDELGQLASSFNSMASQLQKSFNDLEKTNRNLEKLVFENQLLKNAELEDYQYQIGGTLPLESPTYVVRQADRLLYKALKQKQFCYIFNARQMGKSSLVVKIANKLSEEGLICPILDLTEILSSDFTEEQFYNSIIFNLVKKLNLSRKDYRIWKKNLDELPSFNKLAIFIEEIVFKQIKQNLIIFIDEIDTVLDLKFSVDSFFGFWRSLYNKRAYNNSYSRLTIVLIGRTTPHYLIQNPESAPFNIGVGIPLSGFKFQEIQQSYLINGLQNNCESPHIIIKEILKWTNGQPFLTQKICQLIKSSSAQIKPGQEKLFMEKLITEKIINNWEFQDEPEHLKIIRDKFIKNKHAPLLVLQNYRKILQIGEIQATNKWEDLELFLSGIVRQESGKFKIYNLIYEKVFNLSWVESNIKHFL